MLSSLTWKWVWLWFTFPIFISRGFLIMHRITKVMTFAYSSKLHCIMPSSGGFWNAFFLCVFHKHCVSYRLAWTPGIIDSFNNEVLRWPVTVHLTLAIVWNKCTATILVTIESFHPIISFCHYPIFMQFPCIVFATDGSQVSNLIMDALSMHIYVLENCSNYFHKIWHYIYFWHEKMI